MKFVYLIMYLWHHDGVGNWSMGGPAFTVSPMPSLTVCEKVGAQAKVFADTIKPRMEHSGWFETAPAEYRCVEVDDKPTPTPKCAP